MRAAYIIHLAELFTELNITLILSRILSLNQQVSTLHNINNLNQNLSTAQKVGDCFEVQNLPDRNRPTYIINMGLL